jgi:hypothetical protein
VCEKAEEDFGAQSIYYSFQSRVPAPRSDSHFNAHLIALSRPFQLRVFRFIAIIPDCRPTGSKLISWRCSAFYSLPPVMRSGRGTLELSIHKCLISNAIFPLTPLARTTRNYISQALATRYKLLHGGFRLFFPFPSPSSIGHRRWNRRLLLSRVSSNR